jgi:hypothetical protein
MKAHSDLAVGLGKAKAYQCIAPRGCVQRRESLPEGLVRLRMACVLSADKAMPFSLWDFISCSRCFDRHVKGRHVVSIVCLYKQSQRHIFHPTSTLQHRSPLLIQFQMSPRNLSINRNQVADTMSLRCAELSTVTRVAASFPHAATSATE